MRRTFWLFVVLAVWPSLGHTEDLTNRVKKAVERSTLNQIGTKPFHLKAELAPSREQDKDSGRAPARSKSGGLHPTDGSANFGRLSFTR